MCECSKTQSDLSIILKLYGLCNLLKEPTRVRIQYASLTDLFITNVNIHKTFRASTAAHLNDRMPMDAVIDNSQNQKTQFLLQLLSKTLLQSHQKNFVCLFLKQIGNVSAIVNQQMAYMNNLQFQLNAYTRNTLNAQRLDQLKNKITIGDASISAPHTEKKIFI